MDPVLAKKKPDPGLCTSNEERFLKFYWMNILYNFKRYLFYFHTFGVRRSIDVLDSENQPWLGSRTRALGLTEDVWRQKYNSKKETFKIIWDLHLIEFLKPSFVRGTKPWIRFLGKTGSTSLLACMVDMNTHPYLGAPVWRRQSPPGCPIAGTRPSTRPSNKRVWVLLWE